MGQNPYHRSRESPVGLNPIAPTAFRAQYHGMNNKPAVAPPPPTDAEENKIDIDRWENEAPMQACDSDDGEKDKHLSHQTIEQEEKY